MTSKGKPQTLAGKIWHFLWEEDSILSWIANIVLAFILIKFIVFPGLGLLLGTSYPVVAVVSGSMSHDSAFDEWWSGQETLYQQFNISRPEFESFPLKDGFNKGDIIVLRGVKKEDLKVGEVVVFRAQDAARRPDPIIHRVVLIKESAFATKGDHNLLQIKGADLDETNVPYERMIGKAWVRIPFLGYIKIWFVEFLSIFKR